MKLNRSYPAVLWIFFVGGAPLATAVLALITIPLLLTEVDAGLVLLLAPGVVTVGVLVAGLAAPGNVPRDVYASALKLGLARLIIPAAMVIAWYNYFDASAREETLPLVLLLLASGAVSLALWAWSMDSALGVLTHLDAGHGSRAVAKRVDIKQSMGRDQRKEMLKSRERRGRISRAIAGTRPPSDSEAGASPPGPAVIWTEAPEEPKRQRRDLRSGLERLRGRFGGTAPATPPTSGPVAVEAAEERDDVVAEAPSERSKSPRVGLQSGLQRLRGFFAGTAPATTPTAEAEAVEEEDGFGATAPVTTPTSEPAPVEEADENERLVAGAPSDETKSRPSDRRGGPQRLHGLVGGTAPAKTPTVEAADETEELVAESPSTNGVGPDSPEPVERREPD